MTVTTILAEAQGFEFMQNIRQLCSYAGYDVIQIESGINVKGKTKIYKKGNSRIKAALFFPAMVASNHNPDLMNTYHRITKTKEAKWLVQQHYNGRYWS